MYICNNCKKEFKRKANLTYHQKKRVCNGKIYGCKYCDNKFTTKNNMYRHMKHNCAVKKEEECNKREIYKKLLVMQTQIDLLEEKSKKLEKENSELKRNIKNSKVINNVTNNINHGTINNIILVGYGNEDINKIDKKEILKDIKSGFYSTVKLTNTIHFNPKYPEYHNVYISSMKSKYAMMYDGNDWTLITKEELIDKLYNEKKDYIEENLDEFVNSLSKSQKSALERWMDTDEDHDKIKEVKEKIKLLLYNKRNIPLNNKDNYN